MATTLLLEIHTEDPDFEVFRLFVDSVLQPHDLFVLAECDPPDHVDVEHLRNNFDENEHADDGIVAVSEIEIAVDGYLAHLITLPYHYESADMRLVGALASHFFNLGARGWMPHPDFFEDAYVPQIKQTLGSLLREKKPVYDSGLLWILERELVGQDSGFAGVLSDLLTVMSAARDFGSRSKLSIE